MYIEIWAIIFEILLGFHLSSFAMLSKAEISSVYREMKNLPVSSTQTSFFSSLFHYSIFHYLLLVLFRIIYFSFKESPKTLLRPTPNKQANPKTEKIIHPGCWPPQSRGSSPGKSEFLNSPVGWCKVGFLWDRGTLRWRHSQRPWKSTFLAPSTFMIMNSLPYFLHVPYSSSFIFICQAFNYYRLYSLSSTKILVIHLQLEK